MKQMVKMENRIFTLFIVFGLNFCHGEVFSQLGDYSLIQSEFLFVEPEVEYSLPLSCFRCGTEKFISGIRVVQFISRDNSNMFLFNKEIIDNSVDCIFLGPTLFGDSIVEQDNGISSCYNIQGEEIILDRLMNLGETKRMYSFDDGRYIAATVTSIGLEEILGDSDTVKCYSLQCFKSDDNPTEHQLNGIEIKLSRSYGLIDFISFRDFPFLNQNPLIYTLISNSKLNNEQFSISLRDIYDFAINDEFHYRNQNTSLGPNGIENVVRKVIAKQEDLRTDKITYTYQELKWGYQYEVINGEEEWSYFQVDTVYSEIYEHLDENIVSSELLPLEGIYKLDSSLLVNLLMYSNPEHFNNRYVIREHGVSLAVEECMTHPPDSYSGLITYYIVGCGHELNLLSVGGTSEDCLPCEQLVYFKKGEEIWGEPLSFDKHEEIKILEIFPNPANEFVEIQSSSEILHIEIYNAVGRLINSLYNIGFNTKKLNISHYLPGVYIVKVKNAYGVGTTNKLVIK